MAYFSAMNFDPIHFLQREGVLAGAEETRAEVLAGGFWNDVLRVRGDGVDLVVKHFGERSTGWSLFPIVPECEARAMELLKGRAIAPDFVGFWPASSGHGAVLVYQFVPGTTWNGDPAEAARVLRRAHGIKADGFRVMPATAAELLADADRLVAPGDDDPLWHRLQKLRPVVAVGQVEVCRTFVHGDFNSGNMISGDEGARIIDWQCPGLGDPAEDLWSFLSPAFQAVYGLTPWLPGEIASFCDAYGDDATVERLGRLTPYFAYRYAKYCITRARDLATGDPTSAKRYLDAALAGIASMEET
ncbi:MAG: aminoglycoside phosphotransferase family protein [Rhodospirillaceae bacterium]|nr:aminoglycoside phosphotransferase family protein [Rhodospirillaceae bacterium]MBT6512566.1 aminoglycoside phosphotransferase family protein [Rhodospirillaceae bacterium]MBT7648668.1 aminoglycoside phosphotransferase family protein [Rhodospirillaceae bacterium]